MTRAKSLPRPGRWSRAWSATLAAIFLLTACGSPQPSAPAEPRISLGASTSGQVRQSAGSLPCHGVFELTIQHPGQYANNFFDAALSATFTSPEGVPHNIPGFFFGGDTWKVRFRPDTPGRWTYGVVLTDNDGVRLTADDEFVCTASAAEGQVRRNPTNPFGWETGDGLPFFPIGLQDCWDPDATDLSVAIDGEGRDDGTARVLSLDEYFATFGQAGFNLFRFSQNNCAYQLYTDLDHYSEKASLATDQLLASARRHHLRVMFGFFGFDRSVQHALDNATALNWLDVTAKEKRFLAYCVARWGVYVDFWELLNESTAAPAWTTLMADYVRGIDPDRKPITSSAQPPSKNPVVAGTDFVSPHWYELESEFASDSRTAQLAGDWKRAGLPVIVGEQGNMGMNWDPRSGLRMRIRTWTALFEQIGLVLWNTSWSKAGMNGGTFTPDNASNIYLGPEERGYIRALAGFASRLDAGITAVPMSVSDPGSVRVYGLASDRVTAAYLHHSQNHTTPVAGMLSLTVSAPPGSTQSLDAEWIDPSSGATRSRVRLLPGQQTVPIPSFTVDLALLVSPSADRSVQMTP